MTGKAVDWYSDVFDTVFPDMSTEYGNNVWAKELKKTDDKKKDKSND